MLSNAPFKSYDAEITLDVRNSDDETVTLCLWVQFFKDEDSRGNDFWTGDVIQIRSTHPYSGNEFKSWRDDIEEAIQKEARIYKKAAA